MVKGENNTAAMVRIFRDGYFRKNCMQPVVGLWITRYSSYHGVLPQDEYRFNGLDLTHPGFF
jgi:hypothetical protein